MNLLSRTIGVRLFRQLFLMTYLFLTIAALSYTLARKQIPHLPWPFVTHFYAMMAPFQNYVTENAELMIYGKNPDGSWTKIDYRAYFPFSRGEYAIRIRLSSFSDKKEKYMEIAKKIFITENAYGQDFTAVRLQWEKWPKSKDDFYGNYVAGQVTKNTMAEYSPDAE